MHPVTAQQSPEAQDCKARTGFQSCFPTTHCELPKSRVPLPSALVTSDFGAAHPALAAGVHWASAAAGDESSPSLQWGCRHGYNTPVCSQHLSVLTPPNMLFSFFSSQCYLHFHCCHFLFNEKSQSVSSRDTFRLLCKFYQDLTWLMYGQKYQFPRTSITSEVSQKWFCGFCHSNQPSK